MPAECSIQPETKVLNCLAHSAVSLKFLVDGLASASRFCLALTTHRTVQNSGFWPDGTRKGVVKKTIENLHKKFANFLNIMYNIYKESGRSHSKESDNSNHR